MSQKTETAEARFRAAFDRLKANTPARLEKGTPVSQNNVALEAGTGTTALRKMRYPQLVKDIQEFVDERDSSRQARQNEKRAKHPQRLEHEQLVARLTAERDWAQSQLSSAHRQLLEVLEQNSQLKTHLEEHLPKPVRLRP